MTTLMSFGFTLFVTLSLIRLLSLNAHHVGLVDIARSRKTHKTDIPTVECWVERKILGKEFCRWSGKDRRNEERRAHA